MRTGVGLASPTAVSIANNSICESGELIGSMTSQSKPAALREWATGGEALCSTTPTVGRALSFAKKDLLPIIVVTMGTTTRVLANHESCLPSPAKRPSAQAFPGIISTTSAVYRRGWRGSTRHSALQTVPLRRESTALGSQRVIFGIGLGTIGLEGRIRVLPISLLARPNRIGLRFSAPLRHINP